MGSQLCTGTRSPRIHGTLRREALGPGRRLVATRKARRRPDATKAPPRGHSESSEPCLWWRIVASVIEVRCRLADEGGNSAARMVRRAEVLEQRCPLLVEG